jgi:glycosyltransferase involved in cell wall biosynthesis
VESKISVFITSYNQKTYLIEAIESVLSQTLRPFEIIIVDDCSTDGSQKVIAGYAQVYPDLIKPYYHRRNLGIPANKRFALEHVRGDLVTYLDGDDRYIPEKLELELEIYQAHPEAKIVYSNYYYIDPEGQRIGLWADSNTPPPIGYVFPQVFGRCFPHGSLFRNELIEYQSLKKVGFYDDDLAMYEDWELRVRLTNHYRVAYCPEPLAEYRIHSGGVSKSPSSSHYNELRKVYEKNRFLLESLPEADRVMIRKKLFTIFAHFAQLAAWEEAKKKNIRLGLKYWIESFKYNLKSFHHRLPVHILLPQ